jgi:hypothetical protein
MKGTVGLDMASRAPLGPFIICVTFEPREDGGLRAYAEKVPGFLLSHSDPEKVMRDVESALSVILTEMYGAPIQVTQAVELDDAIPKMPAHLCGSQSYVGLASRQ